MYIVLKHRLMSMNANILYKHIIYIYIYCMHVYVGQHLKIGNYTYREILSFVNRI